MGADYTFGLHAPQLCFVCVGECGVHPGDGCADLAAHSPPADAGPERPRRSAPERVDHVVERQHAAADRRVVERAAVLPVQRIVRTVRAPARACADHDANHSGNGRTAARIQRGISPLVLSLRAGHALLRQHDHPSARRLVRRRDGVHARALPDAADRAHTSAVGYWMPLALAGLHRYFETTPAQKEAPNASERRRGVAEGDRERSTHDGRGWCYSPARG